MIEKFSILKNKQSRKNISNNFYPPEESKRKIVFHVFRACLKPEGWQIPFTSPPPLPHKRGVKISSVDVTSSPSTRIEIQKRRQRRDRNGVHEIEENDKRDRSNDGRLVSTFPFIFPPPSFRIVPRDIDEQTQRWRAARTAGCFVNAADCFFCRVKDIVSSSFSIDYRDFLFPFSFKAKSKLIDSWWTLILRVSSIYSIYFV